MNLPPSIHYSEYAPVVHTPPPPDFRPILPPLPRSPILSRSISPPPPLPNAAYKTTNAFQAYGEGSLPQLPPFDYRVVEHRTRSGAYVPGIEPVVPIVVSGGSPIVIPQIAPQTPPLSPRSYQSPSYMPTISPTNSYVPMRSPTNSYMPIVPTISPTNSYVPMRSPTNSYALTSPRLPVLPTGSPTNSYMPTVPTISPTNSYPLPSHALPSHSLSPRLAIIPTISPNTSSAPIVPTVHPTNSRPSIVPNPIAQPSTVQPTTSGRQQLKPIVVPTIPRTANL